MGDCFVRRIIFGSIFGLYLLDVRSIVYFFFLIMIIKKFLDVVIGFLRGKLFFVENRWFGRRRVVFRIVFIVEKGIFWLVIVVFVFELDE